MISFKQFLITEEKVRQSKNTLQKLIKECVEQFRSDLKKSQELKIKPLSIILLESIDKMVDVDLHQTEQDTKALKKFVAQYKKLKDNEKVDLVKKLSQPINGKGYIENNNEVKLILIYKEEPNSYAGQEAYNAVVMNKQGLFKAAANKKVHEGKMTPDQAADYVSEMFATLCGGGQYNSKNGGAFSLDAYDPFSGVPFNSFLKEKVIPSAYNRFQATYNTSIANDYVGQKENTSVISVDKVRNAGDSDDKDMTELDFIADNSENGRDPSDVVDEREKKKLIKMALNDENLPKEYRLTNKEKQFIKLFYFEGLGKKEAALKMGYKTKTAAPVARLYLGDDKNMDKNGSAVKHLIRAVKYLQKQQVKNPPTETENQEKNNQEDDQSSKELNILLSKALTGEGVPQKLKLNDKQAKLIKKLYFSKDKDEQEDKEDSEDTKNKNDIKEAANKLRKIIEYLKNQQKNKEEQ